MMLPWFDRPITYDVRARPSVIQSASGSKDLQTVWMAPVNRWLEAEACFLGAG
jgi:hypothetical protein